MLAFLCSLLSCYCLKLGSYFCLTGSVELASAGVSMSIFNIISKLFNIPLLSVATSFVAEDIAKNATKVYTSGKWSVDFFLIHCVIMAEVSTELELIFFLMLRLLWIYICLCVVQRRQKALMVDFPLG